MNVLHIKVAPKKLEFDQIYCVRVGIGCEILWISLFIVDACEFLYITAGSMRYVGQHFCLQQIYIYLFLLSVTHTAW